VSSPFLYIDVLVLLFQFLDVTLDDIVIWFPNVMYIISVAIYSALVINDCDDLDTPSYMPRWRKYPKNIPNIQNTDSFSPLTLFLTMTANQITADALHNGP